MKTEIIKILNKIIDVSEELTIFNKSLIKDPKERTKFNKFLKLCQQAREYLPNIKHEDVLTSLYRNIVCGKESVYTMCPALICHKATRHFDTEKGHAEFLKLEKVAREEEKKAAKEIAKKRETMKIAKEQGKNLDFIVKDGKMEQVVVDTKDN